MPRSAYLEAAIDALLADYAAAFPSTLYPASRSTYTHITPDEERIKKLVFVSGVFKLIG
jgi:hypothetical protein